MRGGGAVVNQVLSVDPGDKYVGYSSWIKFPGSQQTWRVAKELPAEGAVAYVNQRLRYTTSRYAQTLLVIEKFVLYADKAMEQSWQPMLTSEMIGALKWVASTHGVKVVEQGANIQEPTRAQLIARGIKLIPAGPHAESAQLHLWHRLLKDELVDWTAPGERIAT